MTGDFFFFGGGGGGEREGYSRGMGTVEGGLQTYSIAIE